MQIPTIYKPNSFITFVDNNKATTFSKDNPFFNKIIQLYKEQKWDEIRNYFNLKNYVFKYSNGKIRVGEDIVLYENKEIHNDISTRILQFLKEGIDIGPLCKFLENLMSNPEDHVKQDLFLFLENNLLPITEDGGFVAYKLVKDDYSPFYQGGASERYYIGTEVSLPREKCYNGRTECGGAGLYFGRKEYWNDKFNEQGQYTGGGLMLIAKIMPQDVTSIPSAEYGKKGVCCKMFILDKYESIRAEVYNKAVFGVKKDIRPEAIEQFNAVAEATEGDSVSTEELAMTADEYISKKTSEFTNKYEIIEKPKKKIMRDAKGHFLSKKFILAKMPKRDKHGRFVTKSKR